MKEQCCVPTCTRRATCTLELTAWVRVPQQLPQGRGIWVYDMCRTHAEELTTDETMGRTLAEHVSREGNV